MPRGTVSQQQRSPCQYLTQHSNANCLSSLAIRGGGGGFLVPFHFTCCEKEGRRKLPCTVSRTQMNPVLFLSLPSRSLACSLAPRPSH
eukprot:2853006-Rhodomonas_salina.2